MQKQMGAQLNGSSYILRVVSTHDCRRIVRYCGPPPAATNEIRLRSCSFHKTGANDCFKRGQYNVCIFSVLMKIPPVLTTKKK